MNSNIAVVIVNYRTTAMAEQCLASLASQRTASDKLNVIVVDGGSGNGSAELLAETIAKPEFRGWVSLLALSINGGFGWANNQALLRLMQRVDAPEFVYLLNPDTMVEPDAVAALSRFLVEHPGAGAVGSQLLEPGGALAASAFRFPTVAAEFGRGARFHRLNRLLGMPEIVIPPSDTAVEVDWVTGASVMFRLEALKQSGLFDDGFFLYHEEVELMWRLKKSGWSIWHEPISRVVHVGGVSTGVDHRMWVDGRRSRLPSYWYESRRRLFARIYGAGGARAAGWAWVIGHVIFRLRRAVGVGCVGAALIDHEFDDHRRLALRPTRHDSLNAACSWDTEPGKRPAWMNFGE